jgi:hypothetical protein
MRSPRTDRLRGLASCPAARSISPSISTPRTRHQRSRQLVFPRLPPAEGSRSRGAGVPRQCRLGAVCDYLKRARLAEYAWLSNSTAWSGYASFTNWNIRQGKQSPSLSFSHDSNEARGEYGGFQVAEAYSSL